MSDSPVPTPKTQRGQASRDRLVEVAAQSVVAHGIHKLRLDEVLSAASCSKSQMYHYFQGRDGLVEAAVTYRCTEVLDQLAAVFESVGSLDDLTSVLTVLADEYAVHLAGCPIGTLASELTSGPEPARRVVLDAFASWESFLAQALARIRDAGELRSDADPSSLATGLLAAIEGGMFLSQVRRDATPLRAALTVGLGYLRDFRQEVD
ncbi:TetR/AcrR family transcriptional regulator [Actinomadura sp. 6N118]|uniref:TetR/AcrR family transcriptional regulator n=1 Tax=Actinomadura sp. 6N118 TaxID=3375151 RepID=UPI0037B87931